MEFPYESFSRFSDPLQEVAVVAKWPKESLSDASSAVSQRAFLLFLSMTVVVLEENEKEQVNESVKVRPEPQKVRKNGDWKRPRSDSKHFENHVSELMLESQGVHIYP